MNCSELLQGLIGAECGKNTTSGAKDDVILIPFSVVDKTASTITDNVIESLVLSNGKKAFKFSTYGKSLNEAGATFAKGTYRNSWTHAVPLRIFIKNEEAKKFVNTFGDGAKVMVLLKNNDTGTDHAVAYELYGWDNGLELNESANTIALTDGIVYSLGLASAEGEGEGSLPKSVFDTDIATTETMIASLTA